MSVEMASTSPNAAPRKRRFLWWGGCVVAYVALVFLATWLAAWLSVMRDPRFSPTLWFYLLPQGLSLFSLLVMVILWKLPQWQLSNVQGLDPKERFDRVNEARKTLATIMGGIVLIAGFFGTLQSIKVAQEAASVSQKALAVSQEGQITDRFSKAIEQLGAIDSNHKKKLEVRLGGIYALEGIANESKELHWPIMEVLCTYVRVNAPLEPKTPNQKNQGSIASRFPDEDIQAVLTVIGRRKTEDEPIVRHIDLILVDIRRADFYGANLEGANFHGARLIGAHLEVAHLEGAHLLKAQDLTQEQVDAAIGDSKTQLPENLRRPESWKQQR